VIIFLLVLAFLVDITVGNAARLGVSQRSTHATLRVAPHRYATREPLGTSRRLSRVWRGRSASCAQAPP